MAAPCSVLCTYRAPLGARMALGTEGAGLWAEASCLSCDAATGRMKALTAPHAHPAQM